MLTPVISFATGDGTTAGGATGDGEEKVDISTIIGYYELPEAERKAEAIANASFDTQEELLAKFTSYKYLCDNGEYEMYYDAKTLGIIIRDKSTGAIMESVMDQDEATRRKYSSQISANMTSAVAIRTLEQMDEPIGGRNTMVLTSDFVGCKDQKITITELDNGFKANVNYEAMFVSFDVIVTLEEDGVHVEVPYKSITYTKDNLYLGAIYLYSLMGYTERGDRDGYMIIPDGNGAIVHYEDFVEIDNETKTLESYKFGSGYSQFVYGEDLSYKSNTVFVSDDAIAGGNDPEYVYAPYWGVVHNDTDMSVIAVVDKGAESMQVECVFNGVSNLIENFVCGRFLYKRTFYEPTDVYDTAGVEVVPEVDPIEDVKLTFMFRNGGDASYAGLAMAYKDKLIEEGVLTKDKASDELDVRIDFLGTDKEDFLLFKKTVTATTVSNIRKIINTLTEDGVKNMMVLYSGWQSGGVNNVPVSSYNVEGAIGGKAELNKLADDLREKGIDFYLSQDVQYINTSNIKTTFDAARKITSFIYNENRMFEEVYRNFRILYPEKTSEYIKKLAKEFVKNDITNIAFEGLGYNFFTYSKKDVLYSRTKTLEYYKKALESLDENVNVALNQPFLPYWSVIDSFLDMPLGHSMYAYESGEIPFLALILNGTVDCYSEYVNFEADKSEYFLKLAGYGVNPSFMLTHENPSVLQYTNSSWIYTSEYSQYMDQITLYYEKLSAVKALAEGTDIVDYTMESNVAVTTYGNGVKVYCDYKNYILGVYKDGEMVFGFNPQEETDLSTDQINMLNSYVALDEARTKVEDYVLGAIVKNYVFATKYQETYYSNGVVVYNDYNANRLYVEKDGVMVFGYNTENGFEVNDDELSSFAGQPSNGEVGEADE